MGVGIKYEACGMWDQSHVVVTHSISQLCHIRKIG